MHWGIRRFQNKDGSLTSKGKNRYNNTKNKSGSKDDESKNHGLTDKQKKCIKIGAAVAITGLAIYGGYKLKQSGKIDALINKGKEAIALHGNVSTLEHGFKKLNEKDRKISEVVKRVNPNKGLDGYKKNCTLCSITSFIRSKGYDVAVSASDDKSKNLMGVVENCFKLKRQPLDGRATTFGKSREAAAGMLVRRYGQNASGVVSVDWQSGGGHAFNWKIENGIVSFFDGQQGWTDAQVSNYVWNNIKPKGSLQIVRLDDAEIIWDEVKKICRNR